MVWGLLLLGLRSFRPTEQDTLVSNGLYNYIRHSIYSGLLIDFIVLPLLRPAIPAVLACALGWSFVFIQARLESWIWSSAYLRTASIWSKCLAFSPAFGKGD
jgi:protein-S-isoprenylcysteine O-methyltransferase Ste14